MFSSQTKVIFFFTLLALTCLCAALPLPWNEPIENLLVHARFKLRGERPLSDDILFVFIGAKDVEALGGWPITRDYYGYVTHVLRSRGAKVIGLYFMFNAEDARYPEYDQMLSDLARMSGKVVLPFAFSGLAARPENANVGNDGSENWKVGNDPIYPIQLFRDAALGLGFSNLGEQVVHDQVPLTVETKTGRAFSFGFQLARHYLGVSAQPQASSEDIRFTSSAGESHMIPLDAQGQLRVNHFGDPGQVNSIGFLDLLQTFETAPDSLDLAGKIVIVDVTAPGILTLEATPLSLAVPASLVHATVAENIINQSYLRDLTIAWRLALLALLALSFWLIGETQNPRLRWSLGVALLASYWAAAFLAFAASNLILPLFYPTVVSIATLGGLEVLRARERRMQDDGLKAMMEEQVAQKQAQLERAKLKLDEVGDQLADESNASQEMQQVAEERKQTILALEKQLADLKTYSLPKKEATAPIFSEIVHASDSKMTEILELVPKVASDDIPVLILGETGTGKEMVARAIHESSGRKEAPFIAINCGALPETLLDSELFGHEKGSFTGAQAQRRGRFELAHGGTIFLDEITETSLTFQARLLRVLQERTFERLGGERPVKVDVRVIAATNREIQALIEADNFRADLYYRLNGFTMELPRLRERPTDIPVLVVHFLKKHGYGPAIGISDGAIQALQNYPWPGNVRELENVTRRAALLAKSEHRTLVQLEDLPTEIRTSASKPQTEVDYVSLEDQILSSLRDLQFSRAAISKTAQALGNRDRGTITEYFRGICFREFVQADFEMESAIRAVASTAEEPILANLRGKFSEYLRNLHPLPADLELDRSSALPSQFKGLPKKFHPFLAQVIEHLRNHPSEV